MSLQVSSKNANEFAEGLAERFAERARGADDESARLLQRRASEHVLAGFLTPISGQAAIDWASVGELASEGAAPQPPVDEPTELSNVGCEWLCPAHALDQDGSLEISLGCAVYVRVLPSYGELLKRVSYISAWQHKRDQAPGAPKVPIPDGDREAVIPEVWTRVDFPQIKTSLQLRAVSAKGREEISLVGRIAEYWKATLEKIADLYPTHTHLHITSKDLASESAYSTWKAQQKRTASVSASNWSPRLDVRVAPVPTDPTQRRLVVRVLNCTGEVSPQQAGFSDPNLYNVQLCVRFPRRAHSYGLFRELDQSYRYDRRLAAVGINAHAEASFSGEEGRIDVRTVPVTKVARLDPREIPGCAPSFKTLADNPLPLLHRLADAMQQYYETEWADKICELQERLAAAGQPERERIQIELKEAEADRNTFLQNEVEAFKSGIRLLEDKNCEPCLRAFRYMNAAMGRVAERRGYSEWRLFQLVFIVKSLPELAVRLVSGAEDFVTSTDDVVDILWFAAGGGKTEAFFGVLVWQLFLDRLCEKAFGVTAFLRFPLRLLTFQQLQRLADTLAQADLVRVEQHVPGEIFSLGYFVGSAQTPNTIDNSRHERFLRDGPDKSLLRLGRCPYCGDRSVNLDYDASNRLIRHVCANKACSCPQQSLPLFIVDDDVYRFLPSVIVSTVDKLAIVGQNRRFANLFGRIDRRCAKHGAAFHTSNWMCEASKAAGNGGKPTKCEDKYNVRYAPFTALAPALQIADELHLLRQELGAFDSHYETTIFEVQASLGAKPWKVLGATATIERFEHHARQLYLMPSRRFPGPGPTATSSFYYEESRERDGRLFVGVLGVGRAHTPSVARTKSLLLQELEVARRLVSTPHEFCDRYKLSDVRETNLGHLVFLYELVLTYVLTLKGGDQVSEAIDNRVREELTESQGSGADLVVKMLNSGIDMPEMIDTIEQISRADPSGSPSERIRAIVTTNIISHGVDVDRFGVIVFAGFPRQVAEYIQASARVGRTWPGISVFVPTPQAERDRSVFERFRKFHEYLDRLVEPSAINRWPEPILRRTVPGIVGAYLMAVAAHELGTEIWAVQQVQGLLGHPKAKSLNVDSVVDWCLKALRVDGAPSPVYKAAAEKVVRNTYDRVLRRSTTHDPSQRTLLSKELGTMTSLRDVDDPAQVAIEDKEEAGIFSAFT